MPKFSPAAGQVVADELRTVFESHDTSVHDAARLLSTFIEGCKGSDLAPAKSQRALRALTNSLHKSVESRGDLIDAQRAMVAIKGDSNLEVYDFGCWMGSDKNEPASALHEQA